MVARAKVRLDAIDREIALILDEVQSPAENARQLRDFAAQALQEGQEQNREALGFVPEHKTFVDGAERGDLSNVGASSVIVFEFQLLKDVVEWIDEQLILHSPIGREPKSPEYNRSHLWFADDILVDDIQMLPPAESYLVLNATPYARKIERGLSPQAPDGVYEAVATMAKRRFGNIAYVGFQFASFEGGALGQWARSASASALAKGTRGGDSRKHLDWLTRQPAIYVDPGR